MTYNIRVTNTGTTPVNAIHVFDSFSSDTTFQSASPDPASVNGQLIEWPVREHLNPGGVLNYRVVLHLRPDWIFDLPLENEARVSALGIDTIVVKHSVIVRAVPDLIITDAQVIQAIMPGDRDGIDAPIPMIEGKYTAVRVVINTDYLHSTHVPGVTGRLYYYHPGEDVHFIEPDNGPIVAPPQPNLANNDDTLNFFLPPGYLRGEVRWWVEVNTDHRVHERDYTNNRWPRDPQEKRVINFRPARTYRIGYVPIAWAATGADTPHTPSTQIETADWFLNPRVPPLI